jgi:hypothetical protein
MDASLDVKPAWAKVALQSQLVEERPIAPIGVVTLK